MTRFVADAIGVRSGRSRSGLTRAERERQLEEFKRTGRHPELDAAAQRGPAGLAIPGRLPDRLLTRPHAFLDVGPAAGGSGPTRRLVVELFVEGPSRSAASAFLSRCRPGADGGFAGGPLSGIVPGTALFGGGPAPPRAPRPASVNSFKHCEPGVVSLSTTGGGFAVALVSLPSLDSPGWAVVGRLTPESLPAAIELGNLTLATLRGAAPSPLPPGAKPPASPLTIRAAGETDARGAHEAPGSVPAAPAEPESPRTAAARVAAEAEKARAGVAAALEAGLAAEKEVVQKKASAGAGRKRGLDELLGGGGSGSDDGESE